MATLSHHGKGDCSKYLSKESVGVRLPPSENADDDIVIFDKYSQNITTTSIEIKQTEIMNEFILFCRAAAS